MSMILQQAKAIMESIATLHIEKLPEGLYLATSDDFQGWLLRDARSPKR
jgi:hypothetical protein